jgi:uncharacterized protein CbrC (UPF0167 family)
MIYCDVCDKRAPVYWAHVYGQEGMLKLCPTCAWLGAEDKHIMLVALWG